jgi:hypothetical protein
MPGTGSGHLARKEAAPVIRRAREPELPRLAELRRVRAHEADLGLDRWPRIAMGRFLPGPVGRD